MRLFGIDAFTGAQVVVSFDSVISGVDELVTPLEGLPYVAPGWIDLQVNGYAAVDYNNPATSHEEIARSLAAQHEAGTTRILPTVITGPPGDMAGSLRNLAKAKDAAGCASIEGFHVEGPHISPEDGPRGAHPARWVRPPDLDEYRRWQGAAEGQVKLVTLAPEWPGATGYIEELLRDGVVAAIGHTNASTQQIQDAVSAGATMSTHLGNGAHSMLPRHPNYIWDQLAEDRLVASFIVDGHHLGVSYFKAALRAKGVIRSVLVTDAAMPAGAAPGVYRLGEVDVELKADGRVVLRGENRLAGSALRMDEAISNTIRQTGASLAEAVTMATRNPARVGRVAGRQRGLVPGERADLVVFELDGHTKSLRVVGTYVAGEQIFSR